MRDSRFVSSRPLHVLDPICVDAARSRLDHVLMFSKTAILKFLLFSLFFSRVVLSVAISPREDTSQEFHSAYEHLVEDMSDEEVFGA